MLLLASREVDVRQVAEHQRFLHLSHPTVYPHIVAGCNHGALACAEFHRAIRLQNPDHELRNLMQLEPAEVTGWNILRADLLL